LRNDRLQPEILLPQRLQLLALLKQDRSCFLLFPVNLPEILFCLHKHALHVIQLFFLDSELLLLPAIVVILVLNQLVEPQELFPLRIVIFSEDVLCLADSADRAFLVGWAAVEHAFCAVVLALSAELLTAEVAPILGPGLFGLKTDYTGGLACGQVY
jgi:hypothetical protein